MAEKRRCEECGRNFPSFDALEMHNAAKHSQGTNKKGRYPKSYLVTAALICILLFAGYSVLGYYRTNPMGGSSISPGEIQKVNLGMGRNYEPNTIKVKSGTPVEITLDSSVKGCYRSFSIPQLGVSKYSNSPSETIKFTPDKKGTFKFQCSMGMGTGTIVVE